MTDYTQNVYFAPKDSLTAGDPSKKIKGSEIDAEFSEIQTAITSKEDKSSKAQANGYASLDANGDVPDAQIAANIPRLASSNVFTLPQRIESGDPGLIIKETDAIADAKVWRVLAAGAVLSFQTLNDAETVSDTWLTATRTANDVTALQINAAAITLNGAVSANSAAVTGALTAGSLTVGGNTALTTASNLNASLINAGSIGAAYVPQAAVTQHQAALSLATSQVSSGTFADARIAQSNVTQHQAALTIAETQISDGSVFPRISATETISGAWTFSGVTSITRSGAGRYLSYASATNNSGSITTSTSAATGTPGNGDLWIQHAA